MADSTEAAKPKARNQFPPINAIVAKLVPDGSPELFYPIFPSHFMLPIKPGEYVWVLYPEIPQASGGDTPDGMMGTNQEREVIAGRENVIGGEISALRSATSNPPLFQKALVVSVYTDYNEILARASTTDHLETYNEGFWLARVAGTQISEDVNFTALDRDLDERIFCTLTGREPGDVLGDAEYAPGYPNGVTLEGETTETYIEEEHLTIKTNQAEVHSARLGGGSEDFTHEAVPPLNKRVGDLVLQGSNNTAIVLGESDLIQQEFTTGLIDIFAGRGLHPDAPNKVTSIASEMGHLEKDKCPQLSEQEVLGMEGEVNIDFDFSRVYVSSNSLVDILFCDPEKTGASENLTFSTTAGSSEGRDLTPIHEEDTTKSLTSTYEEIIGPCIALKSDHIRIVGRETLRLMVESDKGPASAPEIILHKDGNIFIKPGVDGQVYLGDGPDAAPGGPGTAAFADMVTYPDDVEGGPGFVAEMAVAAKIPTRHSTKVKVKL